ncbi:MAG: NAD(P)/FAD-dependent oxidoreductase [Bacteroidia bacterium]
MLSFWDKKEFLHYDFIVVGAGITGLSTACEIKEQKPKATVMVLERGLLPTGASTKNAGFACIGTLSEKVYDLGLMGKDALLQLINNRITGLQLLRNRLGDDNIDYQNNGGFEMILKNNVKHHLDKLDEMNELLFPLLNKNIFSENKKLVEQFGFNKNMVDTIICNDFEGQIDTGKMMKNLINYCYSLGIHITTGAIVNHIESNSNVVKVMATSNQTEYNFTCNKLAVCTNAFTGNLLNLDDITPGRGQVICTTPIPNLKFKGTFNFDEGFYYFRDFENRIIFGGGRNLDFETETTTEFGLNQKIIDKLVYYLKEIIIPDTAFIIEHKWSGIMAFGKNKLPVVKLVETNIVVGARLNGMGVALGSKIAKDVVALMSI